jgi:hypothetical protein
VRRQIAAIACEHGDSLAVCVGHVIRAALTQLASRGVVDPAVVLAAGDHCSRELDDFIRRCRRPETRLRISDSLRIEASRLLEGAASDRSAGLDARVIASAGDAAWTQACDLVLAQLVAGEASGAVACAVRGNVVCAFAIFDDANAAACASSAHVSEVAEGEMPATLAEVSGAVLWLEQALDSALATSNADDVSADARRGDAHTRVADLADEWPRRRSPR